jgi:hypothetical protein
MEFRRWGRNNRLAAIRQGSRPVSGSDDFSEVVSLRIYNIVYGLLGAGKTASE